jgi:hypothetical protein
VKDKVTIVLPVSRSDYLLQVFTALEMMECDESKTTLLVIVDGDATLFVDVRNRVELSKFSERLCVQYNSKKPVKKYSVPHRRKRIADIHNFAKQYIGKSDFILGVEDDTLIPPHTLDRFMQDYAEKPFAGFIEGVELGRWGVYYIGAWKFDDVYEPTTVTSQLGLDEELSPLQEIDSGGFYCFLTRKEVYMDHEFDTFENGTLGPDVNFGISLRREGYMNYIDWRVNCIHRHGDLNIRMPKYSPQQVRYTKTKDKWTYKVT